MQYVFPAARFKHYRFPTHTNDLVMDRSAATTSEVFMVVLEPGEAPPRHKHDDTEQIFFILRGEGMLEIGDPPTQHRVQPDDVVRIPVGVFHRIWCRGEVPLRYLAVDCFVRGRPAEEPTWDAHVRVMCATNGWDYEKITAGIDAAGEPGGRS